MADPVDQFIQTLFDSIPSRTEAFLSTNYPVLGHAVTQPALYLAMIWVAVKVIRVHSGRDPADVWPLVRMLLTIMFVFAALNWGGLAGQIFHSFQELRDDTVNALMGGQSMTQYLENAYNKFSDASGQMMKQSMLKIGIVLLGLVLQMVNTAMVLVALVLKVGSDMGFAVTMLLFPLFVPTLMWNSTRGFGMSWFAAMAKFALVGILLGVIVKFSFDITDQFVSRMDPNAMTANDAFSAIILAGAITLFMAFTIRPLASALTSSGAAGSGMADMIGGFMMSQIMSKFSGGGRGGAGANPGAATALNSISNTQTAHGNQLARIERALSSGGATSPSSMSSPSGAGQPGGPGGTAPSSGTSDGGQW